MKMNARSVQRKTSGFRERRQEAVSEAFLDAAETAIAAKGYERATMQDVAREAGCAAGTLYLYFKNKEELFNAMVARHVRALSSRIRAAFQATEDPLGALKAALVEAVDYFNAHRPFFRVFYTASPGGRAHVKSNLRDGALADYLECQKLETALIERAQELGTVRSDVSAAELVEFRHAIHIVTFARWSAEPARLDAREQVELLWKLTLGGLAGGRSRR